MVRIVSRLNVRAGRRCRHRPVRVLARRRCDRRLCNALALVLKLFQTIDRFVIAKHLGLDAIDAHGSRYRVRVFMAVTLVLFG
jgi:hypothetical protein